ncbi:MAG: hypothetical protein K2Y01_01040 [Rhabdochlamydiaceae bacterium]|nr:hypothetical protein [Rhabdochlamydiaceae bacterium]
MRRLGFEELYQSLQALVKKQEGKHIPLRSTKSLLGTLLLLVYFENLDSSLNRPHRILPSLPKAPS